MYFQKSHFIAVTFYILGTVYYQTVYSKLTLSEPGPPYECEGTLKLRCQSDSADCCNLNTKRWTLDTIQIVSGGNDLTGSGKYTETKDDAKKYFELTINNLHPSDFGKKYVCLYQFDTSPALELKASHLHCKPCDDCGWICYAWACLGTLFGNIEWIICILGIKLSLKIVFVVKGSSVVLKCPHKTSDKNMIIWDKINGDFTKPYSVEGRINSDLKSDLKLRLEIIDGVNLRITDVTESDGGTYQCSIIGGHVSRMQLFVVQKDWKNWIGFGFISIVISFLFCILVAVPVGRYFCFCYDIWDDAYRSYPHLSYIFVGYVVANLVILPFGIILKRMKKGDADTFSKRYYVLFVLLSIPIIPIPWMCLYMHAKAIGPSKWHYFGILVLSLLVVPIPFLCFYIHYKDCKLDGVVTTETLELTGGKDDAVPV